VKLTEDNKETFTVEEGVSLRVQLKNIEKLEIKIFEFNTETYYRKNKKAFDTSVNLDGLHATEEIMHEYNHSSNYKWVEQFDFPQFQDKVGLFIIEFIGNGMKARAVIKKGSMNFVSRSTIQGHQGYILDYNKKICKGKDTGVIFDDQFYKADPQNGAIFIPFGKSEKSDKLIMIHDKFAQMNEFVRRTENIEFSCDFYILNESLLVGSSAQVIVKPKLNINGRKTQIKQLRNSVIELQTDNYIDNLPQTRKFTNVQFEDNGEYVVSFLVPPNLKSIKVSMKSEVLNATLKEIKHLSDSR
jgi:hypothetical protein